MHVQLLAWTGDPERIVSAAARLCYSSSPASDLVRKTTPEKQAYFIKKLLDMGHQSPLEHASYTFAVEGVSRALSHQLVRHRIASYSQKSQRYVEENNFSFITPPSVAASPEAQKLFAAEMEQIRLAYCRLCEMVPKEDARYVLPNACETKLVVTMNARNLLHFFQVRCCRRAQWEIRQLAGLMLKEVRHVSPLLFKHAGPRCETEGVCPEGKFSCGRLKNKNG